MRKKVYAAIVMTLALVFGSFATSLPAYADVVVGGGTGDSSSPPGGGSGSWYDGPRWEYWGPNVNSLRPQNGHWALTTVYRAPDGYPGQGPGVASRAIVALQPECARPDVEAVFVQTIYASNWTQMLWWVKSNWTAGGTYGTLASLSGPNAGVKAQLNAARNTGIGDKTVVCVTGGKPDQVTEEPVYEPATDTIRVTCVYSRSVAIKRQISDSAGRDPIGENNLEDQASVDIITPFGNLLNTYNKADPKPSPAAAKAGLEAECAKTPSSARPKVDLSSSNKAGLAEGGVLNVTEFSRTATYTASQSYEKLKGCNTTTQAWSGSDWYVKSIVFGDCKGTYDDTRNVQAAAGTFALGSANNTGFWQILSVHCNKADFDALMAATPGATIESTNDASGAFSAVAYSPRYTVIPAKLDFGDESNPNAAKAKSGNLSFYDKECPFDCTADKSTTSGASTSNGAVSNAGSTKPAGGTVNKYGATSGVNNDNKFEFFRDNKANPLKLDVWYPKSTGVVSYNGAAPLTTTVNRWNLGTPSLDGSSGGKFEMKASDGRVVFNTSGSPLTQRNWDPTATTPEAAYLYSSPTSAMLKGLVRDFTVQATWASDADKPQVLNVKWEYAPSVSTRFSSTGLGLDASGNITRGGAGTFSTNIQGKCYAQFGTNSGLNTTSMFQQNTGTGVPNGLDGKLVQGDTTSKPVDDTSNLFINFVRATTE